jgi:hypothetical protein
MVFVGGWFIYGIVFPAKKKTCFFGNINSYLLGSPTGESRDAKIAPNSSLREPRCG